MVTSSNNMINNNNNNNNNNNIDDVITKVEKYFKDSIATTTTTTNKNMKMNMRHSIEEPIEIENVSVKEMLDYNNNNNNNIILNNNGENKIAFLRNILEDVKQQQQQRQQDSLSNDNDIRKKKEQLWLSLCKHFLTPQMPFEIHTMLHYIIFNNKNNNNNSNDNYLHAPVYIPDEDIMVNANLAKFYSIVGSRNVKDIHAFSLNHPELYWNMIIKELKIHLNENKNENENEDENCSTAVKILDKNTINNTTDDTENMKWLPNVKFNIVESCFHGRDMMDNVIFSQKEGNNGQEVIKVMTRGDLYERVKQFAMCLRKGAGYQPGDGIAIYMIMNVESIIAYLGIIYAGCYVISIADSFASDVIEQRLRIANAKCIITQDVIQRGQKAIPLFSKVLSATKVTGIPAIVLPSSSTKSIAQNVILREQDMNWYEFIGLLDNDDNNNNNNSNNNIPYIPQSAEETTNILFSSGTTGDPKAIPWTHITPIRSAHDGMIHQDIRGGDVVCWPTNLGWMMGPWLIYAALLNNASIAVYEGSTTGMNFLNFVKKAKVTMLGLVPSLVKAWRQTQQVSSISSQESQHCDNSIDLTNIRSFSSTGEASNYNDMFWLMSQANYKPVIEYCGGTEIGGGFASGTVIQPAIPSFFTTMCMGSKFLLLNDAGEEIDQYSGSGGKGELVLVPPILGTSNRLLNRNHHDTYFKDMPKGSIHGEILRRHGDEFESINIVSNNNTVISTLFRAHGRCDDTMNLGGIKTSSASIERIINLVHGVLETAAIAVPPNGGGPDRLVIFVVLSKENENNNMNMNNTNTTKEELKLKMQKEIKEHENPLFKIYDIQIIDNLIRTASGKIMRRVLRQNYIDKINNIESKY